MAGRPVSLKLAMRQWLAEIGFLDNPFTDEAFSAEGDSYLSDCFVEFPYYDELLGQPGSPGPRFVFAQRGGGKSTLRIQIYRKMENALKDDTRAAVTVCCDQFDVLCERVSWDLSKVTLRMHIEQIIGLVVTRLFELGVREKPLIDLRSLGDNHRRLLRWYIDNFSRCLHPWQLNRLLGKLEGIFYFVSVENILKGTQKVSQELAKAVPGAEPIVAALNDIVQWKTQGVDRADVPSRDLVEALLEICQELGLHEVVVLIDNVDAAQYAGEQYDFEPAFNLIRSLGAAVDILRLPGFVVKFFLPAEMLTRADTSFRFDIFKERQIEWDQEALAHILRQRLSVFSNGVYTSLAPLCEENLQRKIDRLLLSQAQTPRELLHIGNELLMQHFRFPTKERLLTQAAWQRAVEVVEDRRQRSKRPST